MCTLVYVIVLVALICSSCYAQNVQQDGESDILPSEQLTSLSVERAECPLGFICCPVGFYNCGDNVYYYTTTTGPTSAGTIRCSSSGGGGTGATLFYFTGNMGTGCRRLTGTLYRYDGLQGRITGTGTLTGTINSNINVG
jgi:hypothetical protein